MFNKYIKQCALAVLMVLYAFPSYAIGLVGNNYKLPVHVLSMGGGVTLGSSYSTTFTVGETWASNELLGNSYTSAIGYQSIISGGTEPAEHAIAVDMNFSTRSYDNDEVTFKDIENNVKANTYDIVTVAIVAQNVQDLDTFQVEIVFDSSKLDYVGAVEEDVLKGISNFLKVNSGQTLWMPANEIAQGRVSLACSLVGSDPAIAPDGSGIIALVHFRLLQENSSTSISLDNVFFVNSAGRNSQVTDITSGVITTASSSVDSDEDGIEDSWELTQWGNLAVANKGSDYDDDGYTDYQEYLNMLNNILDPDGNLFDPKVINAPHGEGYKVVCIAPILMLLLN